MRRLFLGAALCALAAAAPAQTAGTEEASADGGRWPAVHSRVTHDPAIEARIDGLLARMSVEQKVAQVIQPDIASITPEQYARYNFGSILAGGNRDPGGVPTAQLARLIATLRRVNPAAPIEGAERGVALELPALPDAEPYDLPETNAAAAEPIRPYRLDISDGGDWASFSVWLSALLAARGDDIVRVKGVVTSPDGRLLLQSVRKVVQPPEILPAPQDASAGPAPEDDIIILIGRGMDESTLARSWRRALGSD